MIARAAADAIVEHARAAAPRECCGLLLGAPGRIDTAWRARNADPAASRFLVDPSDHFAAIRHARAAGQSVVGVYHSHPHSAPLPSPSDVAEASYPEYVYVIAGVAGDQPEVRAYALRDTRLIEVELLVNRT